MSEKLYAFLLRLYPAHFRNLYGEDALQLFRDRLRDEGGLIQRLRLWVDVLSDVAVSAPHEHRRAAITVAVPAEARLFQMLEIEPPRPATFFVGGALALASVAAFILLLSYAGLRKPFRRGSSATSQVITAGSVARSSATQLSAGGQAQSSASDSAGSESQRRLQEPEAAFLLDPAERRRVIAAVIANLRQYEDDREAVRHIVPTLLNSERTGRYNAITSGREFADLLNAQMLAASRVRRIVLFYTNVSFTSIDPTSTTHRIDDHFAISIPIGKSEPSRRSSGGIKRPVRFS